MAYQTIELTEADGIATLRLNRPQTLNGLTLELVSEMIHALDTLRDAGQTRVLLLTGAGRAFCSGADLGTGVTGDATGPRDAGLALETHYNPMIERLMALPFPVVTAVNGPAAGAGCSLALTGDIVIAAKSAYFLQAFINIGLIPDAGSTWLLPRAIGRARATGMMMLGDRIPAETAESWGLIWKSVEDASLMEEAGKIAAKLAAGPTQSYAILRRGIRTSLKSSLTETLYDERVNQRAASRTEDFIEGVMAFLQKRRAVFKGR